MMHALALPQLSPAIPLKLLITGQDAFVAPLTIALLEANVITDAMLRPGRNAPLTEVFTGLDARELAMRALTKWWTATVKENSCKFFRWSLHVQSLDSADIQPDYIGQAFFIFQRIDGDRGIPRFALERRLTQLEKKLEGFGQTVLAVLYDATMRLPDSLTPWRAAEFAEYLHWQDSTDDADLLETRRIENGYATIQEVIDNGDVLTRAEFFKYMPEWVAAPRRVVSRVDIGCAKLTKYELDVVCACDAIAALVSGPGFTLHPSDKGAYRAGEDSCDGAMVLLWRQGDVVGQVIDDALNHTYESGNGNEFLDANPVPMTAAGIRKFQNLTEQMMQLAVLTEKLVLLIGDRL
jgi:PRTRC genetic system protein F